MTVGEFQAALSLTAFALPDETCEVTGGYAGDLLSWVMGRAEGGCAWVTIMSNPNIVAVAHLSGAACIVLAEGVVPDEGVTDMANMRGVNLLGSSEPTFTLCGRIHALL